MSQVNLEDTEIENERLELNAGTIYFLGPNLTLRNCTLVLKVPARDLIIPQAQFINCTIDIKKELKNLRWEHATIKGCRLTGRLSGNDFGRWPYSREAPGSIEDCDFTEARLDGCRFMGCDPATLRFPKWPCFTILDPIGRSRELNSVQWPGTFGSVTVEGLSTQPPRTVAVTLFAPAMAERRKTTPEELKAVIEKFDCILY